MSAVNGNGLMGAVRAVLIALTIAAISGQVGWMFSITGRVAEAETAMASMSQESGERNDAINKRLDNIDAKLDRLIERSSRYSNVTPGR